ncbi:MAG TPA: dihydrolipoamide succinyltransferase, partial [Gammaproteobacteria bacterium]|nr:dihydrolipoamide succinyltransferase [Gammaproteobacteria bacterium]
MDVLMPQLGETVAEGTLSIWHKNVGERVEANELLFEISTDKVEMEVPALAVIFVANLCARFLRRHGADFDAD